MFLGKAIIIILWIFLAFTGLLAIQYYVPNPYLDEIFHIAQAQRFCRKDWDWDPAITTPPGLYLVSVALSPFIGCSNVSLRLINWLVGVIGLPWLINDIVSLLNNRKGDVVTYFAYTLSSLPPLWFFSFLYYTDIGSTFFVLLAYDFALRKSAFSSSVSCFFSLWFRQTNIVWTVFIAVTYFASNMSFFNPHLAEATFADILLTIISFLGVFLKNLRRFSCPILSYGAVFCSFLAFLLWNGSIVLGDKSHHQASIHLSQINYFLWFFFFFSFPSYIIKYLMSHSRRSKLLSAVFSKKSFLIVSVLLLIAHFNTYVLNWYCLI